MEDKIDISEDIQNIPEKKPVVAKEVAEKEEKISKAVSQIPIARDEIQKRKENFINFIKKPKVWVTLFLIIAVILGMYIRSLPMHIVPETGHPGLWDITTNNWTLGPDLDPWLFLRTAKDIIQDGSIPAIDSMRNVPLGLETAKETQLLPYMIAGTYYISKVVYSGTTPEFAGDLLPVIMFGLTIIAFFLFVREVFIKKSPESKIKANAIALISTFFMITIPAFLSRTIAGIPEKESAGFFFMFLSFYLFLKSWKAEKTKKAVIFGLLAGISTALMALIWGGVMYVYLTIGGATLVAFIFGKIGKKEAFGYVSWVLSSSIIPVIFSERSSFMGIFASLSTGLDILVLMLIFVDGVIWNTKISGEFSKTKIPRKIISLTITFLLIFLFSTIFFGPNFIANKFKVIHQMIFKPITGRWNTTVAENRQPYFTEWEGSFGPFVKNIPLMFWMLLAGVVLFFKEFSRKIGKKKSWILTLCFALALWGIIFTRYSPNNIFNGENFISKSVYYLVITLFGGIALKFYSESSKTEDNFKQIDYASIFLLVLFILGLLSARGAVRIIMVFAPIATIFAGYLIVEIIDRFRKAESKTILGILMIIIILSGIFTFWAYFKIIGAQSSSMIPSSYNQQWQKAMLWTRENTSKNAVFAHWWDYGYWVQSIGKRATVLDGGNAIKYWNYLMGRHVLTGNNEQDALEFLYNHDADYLLIDSTDIGKYSAYSSIGSNEDYDRFSWIPTLTYDPKNNVETKEGITRMYNGGFEIDEDLTYIENGKQVFFPKETTGVAGIILKSSSDENNLDMNQPEIVLYNNGKQTRLPLRYLEYMGEFYDFGSGLEGCAKVIQKINMDNKGIKADSFGAIIYISPRVMRGMFAQKYLLNDPFNNFPHFKIEHLEDDLVINDLKNYGVNVNDFVYYGGVRGPIKIWKINYTGNEKEKQEYLDKDSSKYLAWKL